MRLNVTLITILTGLMLITTSCGQPQASRIKDGRIQFNQPNDIDNDDLTETTEDDNSEHYPNVFAPEENGDTDSSTVIVATEEKEQPAKKEEPKKVDPIPVAKEEEKKDTPVVVEQKKEEPTKTTEKPQVKTESKVEPKIQPKTKTPLEVAQTSGDLYELVNPKDDRNEFQELAWDKHNKQTKTWSNTIYNTIQSKAPEMLGQNVADDVETFCPKYRSLSDKQRLNFWGQFLVGLAKYESSWDPTKSVVEKEMQGNDSVTKQHITSEGLLQLSYQDEKSYKIDCGFDWSKDKNLKQNDPKKTILNPHLNLKCGIQIFARQLKNRRAIVLRENVYWAPLRAGGKYNRVPKIAAITKKLKFCN